MEWKPLLNRTQLVLTQTKCVRVVMSKRHVDCTNPGIIMTAVLTGKETKACLSLIEDWEVIQLSTLVKKNKGLGTDTNVPKNEIIGRTSVPGQTSLCWPVTWVDASKRSELNKPWSSFARLVSINGRASMYNHATTVSKQETIYAPRRSTTTRRTVPLMVANGYPCNPI